LTRTLVANMVEGVSAGYEKKLMITWVGYGAKLEGKKIILSIWYSHKVDFVVPQNIEVAMEQDIKGNTIITMKGIDKQYLWEVAAKLKALKKPEPYKGKGIRYFDEYIKLKPGKATKK
jgi:large subunit ribosomal protein L6